MQRASGRQPWGRERGRAPPSPTAWSTLGLWARSRGKGGCRGQRGHVPDVTPLPTQSQPLCHPQRCLWRANCVPKDRLCEERGRDRGDFTTSPGGPGAPSAVGGGKGPVLDPPEEWAAPPDFRLPPRPRELLYGSAPGCEPSRCPLAPWPPLSQTVSPEDAHTHGCLGCGTWFKTSPLQCHSVPTPSVK